MSEQAKWPDKVVISWRGLRRSVNQRDVLGNALEQALRDLAVVHGRAYLDRFLAGELERLAAMKVAMGFGVGDLSPEEKRALEARQLSDAIEDGAFALRDTIGRVRRQLAPKQD